MREGYVVARGVWRVLAARRLEGEVGSFFREFLPDLGRFASQVPNAYKFHDCPPFVTLIMYTNVTQVNRAFVAIV